MVLYMFIYTYNITNLQDLKEITNMKTNNAIKMGKKILHKRI
jgi:hypothetical protein